MVKGYNHDDWGGSAYDKTFTLGYLTFVSGNLVEKKQSVIARSRAEA